MRIIGGLFRGRNLEFPDLAGLRPSLGRTRETLFNWLAPSIRNTRCLDLYAGSGALGFEALSRGAAQATMVDSSSQVAQALSDSAAQLGLDASQVTVQHSTAERFLQSAPAPFDLIFLDPPFADRVLSDVLAQIEQLDLLSSDGMIYYEASRQTIFDPGTLVSHRRGQAGGYQYGLLTRHPNG